MVTENAAIQVEAEATHIPEFIEVSIAGAEVGLQIHAKDIELPKGTTLLSDEDLLIVNVTQQISAAALEADIAGDAAGAAADTAAGEAAESE